MSVREYVGARYVPLFADPVDWDASKTYEPLTIVLYQGSSYTSKQAVPAGIDIHNGSYWVETGNFNAQMAEYHQDTIEAKATADEALESATFDDRQINGSYGGRNLATVLADEIEEAGDIYTALHNRVQTSNYSGLRIGDYMDVPLTQIAGTSTLSSVRYIIAGFDHYYGRGTNTADLPSPYYMGRHIVFIPSGSLNATGSSYSTNGFIKWNTSKTNQGTSAEPSPYLNSNLHAWEINEFLIKLPSVLQGYLLDFIMPSEERYSSASSLSQSTARKWKRLGKVWSLSETEYLGQAVNGSQPYSQTADMQLPIFRTGRLMIKGNFWLRNAANNATQVCAANLAGQVVTADADTGNWIQVFPCFLLG